MVNNIVKYCLVIMLAVCPLSRSWGKGNVTLPELCERLMGVDAYRATAVREITLPGADRTLRYEVSLSADAPANGDTLCAAEYLIRWDSRDDENPDVKAGGGFAAYFAGHHYRYHDRRLQEYHTADNPEVFCPGGQAGNGVQNQARFVDMLPQTIGRQLRDMQGDTAFLLTLTPDTVVDGRNVVAVRCTQCFNKLTVMEAVYAFDRREYMPQYSETVYSPGTSGEQQTVTSYDYDIRQPQDVVKTEAAMASAFPEIFAKYRETAEKPEQMKGRLLPPFAMPTITGERYALTRGRGFAVPTVVAVLDAAQPSARLAVESLRAAIAKAGTGAGLVMAFVNNRIDTVENVTGATREGEHILINARGIARDWGIREMPVIFVCGRDGVVRHVVTPDNNADGDFVIQLASVIAD